MSEQTFPLQWPEGWKRTPTYNRERGSQFGGAGGHPTFAKARDRLADELRLLGAEHVVVSTNHKPDRHGVPVEAKRKPDDDGVAVYFMLKKRQLAMARDAYDNAAANMTSLALAIEALRQLERHGGGTMSERAFAGFAAIAPPGGPSWLEVLGVSRLADAAVIREAHRRLVQLHHPDRAGGSDQKMAEINAARDAALKENSQ